MRPYWKFQLRSFDAVAVAAGLILILPLLSTAAAPTRLEPSSGVSGELRPSARDAEGEVKDFQLPFSVVKARAAVSIRPDPSPVDQAYGKLPLSFEANQGQTDVQVKFLSRGRGYTIFLTSTEAVFVFTQRQGPANPVRLRLAKPDLTQPEKVTRTAVRMKLLGANPEPRVTGREELPGKVNYFIGNDPTKWRTNVPTYGKVQYNDVYPGIDLIYYGNERHLEYDLVVGPGADPTRILLAFQGADKLELDAQGDLVLHTAAGAIRQRKPVIYQEVDGARREISGGYVLKGAYRVGFQVAGYDSNRPLVIDPALFYSTYLGGSGDDFGVGIAVDASGNAYVGGQTFSANFPTTPGAFQTAFGGGRDGFVTKLNPTGSALVYSTYLGRAGDDGVVGIAVDASGNAYVTGFTSSTNFPTTAGAFQTTYGGGPDDAFVTKLNPAGSTLVYSTYLGGSGNDLGFGIAIDAAGNAYVTGSTSSANFPTSPGAFQTSFGGVGPLSFGDAFVTKLNLTGTGLVYSTYLGGSGDDEASGIAVDASGNAYVAGDTNSTNFPTTVGAFQSTLGGVGTFGLGDAFVTRLNPTGAGLVYSTYLGGSGNDAGFGIAVDALGNSYVTGQTESTNFPTTPGAFQPALGGGFDGFVAKVSPNTPSGNGVSVSAGSGVTVTFATVSSSGDTTATKSSTGPTPPAGFSLGATSYYAITTTATFGPPVTICITYSPAQFNDPTTLRLFHFENSAWVDVTTSNDTVAGIICGQTSSLSPFLLAERTPIPVTIDIKPGSFPNTINLGSQGTVPVAIFSTPTFDARTVDPTTVTLASAPIKLTGKGKPIASFQDVNGDGLLDLVVDVETSALQLTSTDTVAVLKGRTFSGQPIKGSDSVRIVP